MRRVLSLMAALAWGSIAVACGVGGDAGRLQQADQGSVFASSDCAACVDLACASQLRACTADPECGAHLQCLLACPTTSAGDIDPTCVASCPRGETSTGVALIDDLEACRSSGPGSYCSACGAKGVALVENQTCTTPPAGSENACDTCQDVHCCVVGAACRDDPECFAYETCVKGCSQGGNSGACELSCVAAAPIGATKFAPAIQCVFTYCAEECSGSSPPDACTSCGWVTCRDSFLRLSVDPFGFLYSQCLEVAVTPDELAACNGDYPTAVALGDAWYACIQAQCPSCAQ